MSDTITVYWATWSLPERQHQINFLWKKPETLTKCLPKNGSKNRFANYHACSAFKNLAKNTLVPIHPVSSNVMLGGDYSSPHIVSSNMDVWLPKPNALQDRYRVDYDFGWVFFCEEPLVIQQMAPFMHETTAQKTAGMPLGAFDISRWFRPIMTTYLLWENKNTVSVTEGEPVFYLQFQTEKQIIFKQFELTNPLYEIPNSSFIFRRIKPAMSLFELYDRFISSNRKKVVLKHIKENLLD
jgi:hypothetical protein